MFVHQSRYRVRNSYPHLLRFGGIVNPVSIVLYTCYLTRSLSIIHYPEEVTSVPLSMAGHVWYVLSSYGHCACSYIIVVTAVAS